MLRVILNPFTFLFFSFCTVKAIIIQSVANWRIAFLSPIISKNCTVVYTCFSFVKLALAIELLASIDKFVVG